MPLMKVTGSATSTASGLPWAVVRTDVVLPTGRSWQPPPSCGHTGSNSTRGEDRDPSVDRPRDRPPAARRAGGAGPCGDAFTRGSRGALDQVRRRRAAHALLARPAPAARERSAANAGTQWHQLSVTDSRTCLRARRTLSVVLDGEASATEVAATARHLTGCEDCARFAAVVAELKHCLQASRSGVPRLTAPQVKRG